MRTVLLHLIGGAEWRSALAVGAVHPAPGAEFVHLSTPDQVALPANRLYAGRRDLNVVVLDPQRIGVDIRFEPGVPEDPASMRFPHAYGPVPVAAALAVVPYRPDGGGRFAAPRLGPLDVADRCLRFEPSVVRRMADVETPVAGGVAVRTPAVAASRMHNQLLIESPADPQTVAADADVALAGLPHRMATLFGEPHRPTAVGLAGLGWDVEEFAIMVAAVGDGHLRTGHIEQLDVAEMRSQWTTFWRRSAPDVDDVTIAHLVDRNLLQQAVVDNRYLAVRDGDTIVASAILVIDGATAWLTDVDTDPAHRRRGRGAAIVDDAMALAAENGCDLLALGASVDDWPRQWYARRGFADVERCFTATRA